MSHKFNIKSAPIDELLDDLLSSQTDSLVCRQAIEQGVTEYKGISVQERLNTNDGIIVLIRDEIKRRLEVK